MRLKIKYRKSPNFSERKHGRIDAIVIHHTGDFSLKNSLVWLTNRNSKVSAHYLVGREGEIFLLVEEDKRAWHAGKSHLYGEEDVNEFSIGIELVGNGEVKPYRYEQLKSLILLTRYLIRKYKIDVWRIVGHCHITKRKPDPGRYFPWAQFFVGVYADKYGYRWWEWGYPPKP
jgi:N-acetylmuramoyl-L-alanine amidase